MRRENKLSSAFTLKVCAGAEDGGEVSVCPRSESCISAFFFFSIYSLSSKSWHRNAERFPNSDEAGAFPALELPDSIV